MRIDAGRDYKLDKCSFWRGQCCQLSRADCVMVSFSSASPNVSAVVLCGPGIVLRCLVGVSYKEKGGVTKHRLIGLERLSLLLRRLSHLE